MMRPARAWLLALAMPVGGPLPAPQPNTPHSVVAALHGLENT